MGKVLVVDDDSAIQEYLRDFLAELGHGAIMCRDGKQVVPMLLESSYDLVLLDILIPHLNGFNVIERIRGEDSLKALPVVMMSGIYRSRNHRDEMAERFSVLDYLDKPLPTKRLTDLVTEALGNDPALANPARRKATEEYRPGTAESAWLDESEAQEHKDVESDSRSLFRKGGPVTQGSLEDTPLPEVMGRLYRQSADGAILIRREKTKKIIYVSEGNPTLVKSNMVGECLGRIMLRERLITKEECLASVKRMNASGEKQGKILIDMGCITSSNLDFALELQFEEKLFSCFHWRDGEYRFSGQARPEPANIATAWTGGAVVVEGIRRAYDETRCRELMLPLIDTPFVFQQGEADLAEMHWGQRERQFIEGLRLPASIRALIDEGPLPPPETLRILYSLVALELIKPEAEMLAVQSP